MEPIKLFIVQVAEKQDAESHRMVSPILTVGLERWGAAGTKRKYENFGPKTCQTKQSFRRTASLVDPPGKSRFTGKRDGTGKH